MRLIYREKVSESGLKLDLPPAVAAKSNVSTDQREKQKGEKGERLSNEAPEPRYSSASAGGTRGRVSVGVNGVGFKPKC